MFAVLSGHTNTESEALLQNAVTTFCSSCEISITKQLLCRRSALKEIITARVKCRNS